MVNDPRVDHLMSRLGGVYRDPSRVNRDASLLLKSSVGTHLVPIVSAMVENNGDSFNVLVLQGTIAILFRGQTYQILMDVYMPPGYPTRPPNCFVRLAPNMYLKSNHRHVGSDGKVYLPYLHEWDVRHNLIELVVAMSSVFSTDPPVFTRAAPAPAPPPPAPAPPTTTTQPTTPPRTDFSAYQTQSETEAILAVEIAEANEAAEAARRAELREREERDALARSQARQREVEVQQQRLEAQRRQAFEAKVQVHLKEVRGEVAQHLQVLAKDQQRLELAASKVAQQFETLQERKSKAEKHLITATKAIDEIQDWLAQHASKYGSEPLPADVAINEDTVDDLVQPSCPLTAQMLDLAATNAALSDALYFLDRALYRGVLNCDEHLKQVRALAKQQFLTRAHMLKIQQMLIRKVEL